MSLIIKDNHIGFEETGISDYYDNFKIRSIQLKEAFECIISRYPDIKELFINLANTLLRNNFGPNGTILLGCYYLKCVEDKGVDIKNLISEFRKHNRDPDYLLSSISVLKIGYYFTSRCIRIEFPSKNKKVSNLDIIVWKSKENFKVEIKGRDAA